MNCEEVPIRKINDLFFNLFNKVGDESEEIFMENNDSEILKSFEFEPFVEIEITNSDERTKLEKAFIIKKNQNHKVHCKVHWQKNIPKNLGKKFISELNKSLSDLSDNSKWIKPKNLKKELLYILNYKTHFNFDPREYSGQYKTAEEVEGFFTFLKDYINTKISTNNGMTRSNLKLFKLDDYRTLFKWWMIDDKACKLARYFLTRALMLFLTSRKFQKYINGIVRPEYQEQAQKIKGVFLEGILYPETLICLIKNKKMYLDEKI
jgi:hypothetical protein